MTQLTDVRIESDKFEQAFEVFSAICASSGEAPISTTSTGNAAAEGGRITGFPMGGATITLVEVPSPTRGITAITLTTRDLTARRRALTDLDIPFTTADGSLRIEAQAGCGIRILIQGAEANDSAASSVPAKLDHVALRVHDLAAASLRWTAITGIEGEQMGIHPVSDGTFSAARFPLGERMIELVAPEPGVKSALADRLASHGEGPAALALPAQDLEATLARLSELDVRLLDRPPHWMVHPSDGGGVLLQLTPRVVHESH